LISKSDPKCTVFMRMDNKDHWQKIGTTEVVKDNLNPDFKASFQIFYQFEKHQYLKFEVVD